MQDKNQQSDRDLNKGQEGNDKFPGEEQGKGEPVTTSDLKGKKVDRDITKREDDPLNKNR